MKSPSVTALLCTAVMSSTDSLIGIGSIVLDDARVGAQSLVAAGSLISPGTIIPPLTGDGNAGAS